MPIDTTNLSNNTTPFFFGVRINTGSSITATDVGLYGGEFRWIETPPTGTITTYRDGIISENGISNLTYSSDLRWGGDTEEIGGMRFTVDNTGDYPNAVGNDPLSKVIEDNQISLRGSKATLYRFSETTGSIEETPIYYGECEDIEWDDTQLKISIKSTNYKRNAPAGTLIGDTDFPYATSDLIGKSIPVTFGDFNGEPAELTDADYDEKTGYAKMQRTANDVTNFITSASGTFDVVAEGASPVDSLYYVATPSSIQAFPVISGEGPGVGAPYYIYSIKLGNEVEWFTEHASGPIPTTDVYSISELVGQYLHVVDGTSKGLYRRITDATIDLSVDNATTYLDISVEAYYDDDLSFNSGATASDNSWVQIEDIKRNFNIDTWPQKSWQDNEGNEISSNLNLYAYTDEKTVDVNTTGTKVVDESAIDFKRIPDFGYTEVTGSDNKEVEINAKLFNNNPDKMIAFNVQLPESDNVNLTAVTSNADNWMPGGKVSIANEARTEDFLNFTDLEPLLFGSGSTEGAWYTGFWSSATLSVTGSIENTVDSDKDTYYAKKIEFSKGVSDELRLAHSIEFDPPSPPVDFAWNKVYLLVDIDYVETQVGLSDVISISTYWKRWIGNANEIYVPDNPGVSVARWRDFPDSHWTSPYDNRDLWFYYTLDQENEVASGYKIFEIGGIDTVDKYNTIDKIGILTGMDIITGAVTSKSVETRWNQIGILFSKEISIKDNVYTPIKGRQFNDTWSGRKAVTGLIESPIDVMEHIVRIQNWEDQDTIGNWGKEYATGTLIDVTGDEGSFTNTSIAAVTGSIAAGQFTSARESTTDSLKRSLCSDFFLCNFVKHVTTGSITSGMEGISAIAQRWTDSGYTISEPVLTLDEIIELGDIDIQNGDDIFCEPIIQYRKNMASGEYDRLIQITNTALATYSSSYVLGLSGDDAEKSWRKCRALWLYYRTIEEPPRKITESPWIRKQSDALTKLNQWLFWMGAKWKGNDYQDQDDYIVEPLRRISISVPYEIAQYWFISKRLKLNIPHYTDGVEREGILEAFTHNLKNMTTSARIILLGNQVSY